jgi:hypothetical protein
MHKVTEVWHGRRMVRVRRRVMVRLRASMVMVHMMQRLPMQEPGRHAERRQQPEHTVGGAQTQCAQPTPVSVS